MVSIWRHGESERREIARTVSIGQTSSVTSGRFGFPLAGGPLRRINAGDLRCRRTERSVHHHTTAEEAPEWRRGRGR